MAYQFTPEQTASATVTKYGTSDTIKLKGINGQQTNADNFHTAITGFMAVVGLTSADMSRAITEDVEEAP